MDVREESPAAFASWRPLFPSELETIPAVPGVFELATLVRTVLLIGAAPESLTTTLGDYAGAPGLIPRSAGRVYFRWRTADEPEILQSDLLEQYRRAHGGSLPPAQGQVAPPPPRPMRHLKAV